MCYIVNGVSNACDDVSEGQLERECKHLREQKEKQHLEWKNSNQQHKQNVQAEHDKKVCNVLGFFYKGRSLCMLM